MLQSPPALVSMCPLNENPLHAFYTLQCPLPLPLGLPLPLPLPRPTPRPPRPAPRLAGISPSLPESDPDADTESLISASESVSPILTTVGCGGRRTGGGGEGLRELSS